MHPHSGKNRSVTQPIPNPFQFDVAEITAMAVISAFTQRGDQNSGTVGYQVTLSWPENAA